MQNISQLPLETMLGECSRPFREAANSLEEQRMILVKVTDAAEKYAKRARLVEFAKGFCSGMAVTFFSLSVYWFIQGNYSFALGFLGPALAALVGACGFRMSRFMGK